MHLYEDTAHVLHPGVSKRILINKRVLRDPTGLRTGFATTYDQGSIIGLVYDGMRSLQATTSDEADLFFAPIPISAPPLHPYTSADARRARAAIHADPKLGASEHDSPTCDANCEASRLPCALETLACDAMYDETKHMRYGLMNSTNRRRHFQLIGTSAALGYCISKRWNAKYLFQTLPSTVLKLAWDGTLKSDRTDVNSTGPSAKL